MPQPLSWSVPGVDTTPPPAHGNAQPVTTRFKDLEFSPQGLEDLRCILGAIPTRPGAYATHKDAFDAADVAFFASGCSTDGKHTVGADEFHPVMQRLFDLKLSHDARYQLREKVRKLVFDSATLWDRAFGGSTMVIHVDPTTMFGTPTAPEFLKAHVYLPPLTVVSELPDAHSPLADIVQSFIVHVGLHTKDRWERIGKSQFNWSFGRNMKLRNVPPLPPQVRPIPQPVHSGAAIYVFHGREYPYTLPAITTPAPPATPSASAKSSKRSKQPLLSKRSTSSTIVPSTAPDDMYDSDSPESDAEMFAGDSDISSSFLEAFTAADWAIERTGYQEREHEYRNQIVALRKQVSQLQQELADCNSLRTESSLSSPVAAPVALAPATPNTARVFSTSPSPYGPMPSLKLAPSSSPFVAIEFQSMGTPTATPSQKKKKEIVTLSTPRPWVAQVPTAEASPSSIRSLSTPRPQVPTAEASSTPSVKLSKRFSPAVNFPAAADFVVPGVRSAGPAFQAALVAKLAGYDTGRIEVLHILVRHVPSHYWYKRLLEAGFHKEIDQIIDAMALDLKDS